MKESLRKIFTCDHCKKKYFVKHACEKHEEWCSHNPKNFKACSDCKFCESKLETIHIDGYHGTYSNEVPVYECSKLDKYLIPLKAERKGNAYLQEDLGDGEKENVLMPKNCEHREKINYLTI